MATEWKRLNTFQEVAAAIDRGDEINYFYATWNHWNGEAWHRGTSYRSRPKQKTPEERIATSHRSAACGASGGLPG